MQLTFLALALFIALVTAKCANDQSAVKTVGPLCECKQYQDSGVCCPTSNGYATPSDMRTVRVGVGSGACTKPTNVGPKFPCKNADSKCFELLELGRCARTCSPDQKNYVNDDGQYRFCKDFTERIWDSCKGQEVFNSVEYECQTIEKKFDNVSRLIAARLTASFEIQDSTDDKCINAASATAPAALVTLAAIGSVFGIRNPLFLTLLLVALSSLAVSADCTAGAGKRNAFAVEGMAACDWYKDKTCCVSNAQSFAAIASPTTEFTNTQKPSSYDVRSICEAASDECLDNLNFVSCTTCSPKEFEIGKRVCPDQAKKIWDSCKDSQMFDADKDEFKCKPIKDVYDNSSALLTAIGFSEDDGDDCWNSTSATFFSAVVIALLGLVLY